MAIPISIPLSTTLPPPLPSLHEDPSTTTSASHPSSSAWHKPKLPTWLDDPFAPFSHHHQHQRAPTKLITSHGGKDVIAPSFEVRESRDAYFLEGEFAGVSNAEDVRVEWTGTRTLSVEAVVEEVDLEREWGVVLGGGGGAAASASASASASGAAGAGDAGDAGGAAAGKEGQSEGQAGESKLRSSSVSSLRTWTSERHTGHFLRTFTFPHDVKRDTLRARLSHGVLKMTVTKEEPLKAPRKVAIEVYEGS